MKFAWLPVDGVLLLLISFITMSTTDSIGLTHINLVVVNVTESMPKGLYIRSFEDIKVGSIITMPMPKVMHDYIHIYPSWEHFFDDHKLLKQVVAIEGDTICRDQNGNFSVNGTTIGVALNNGPDGRALPTWLGCKTLSNNSIAVYGGGLPDSLDSRYLGAVPSETTKTYRKL